VTAQRTQRTTSTLSPLAASPWPARRPARERPQARPPLGVVPDPAVLRSQRRARLFTAIAVIVVFFGLFGVVGLHVLLAQGHGEIERLSREVEREEQEQERLRLRVAELESPARVVTAARERLGMVTPTTVVSVAPASLDDPPRTTIPAPRPTTTVATTVATTTSVASRGASRR
jgi:cell division protein FtsL